MSGHNKWKQIKHKKASTDQARSKLFSKFANAISIAARDGADSQFNPALRSAIDQAKKQNMPLANIERAIKRASETGALAPLLIEAYGPEGVGILINAATDSRNRTISELRALFKKHASKLAEPGSLMWSFSKTLDGYESTTKISPSDNTRVVISDLLEELDERDDVLGIYTTLEDS